MPVYEYKCKSCQHVFDELAGFEDKVRCEACGGSTEKLIATTHHPVFIVNKTRFRKKRRL